MFNPFKNDPSSVGVEFVALLLAVEVFVNVLFPNVDTPVLNFVKL